MKEFFRLMCIKRCHCVNKNPLVLSVASGDSFISLRKEEGDERDGDDTAHRGDERHFGDERWIAAVFQTEHRAETRYRHRNDHRIDVVDLIAYPTYSEQKIDAQRYCHKTQERGEIYLRTADNLLQRQFGHRGTDNHQGCRNRNIAHHRYWTCNDIRSMNPEGYQESSHEGSKKGRRKQYLRIELLNAVLALDEHDACCKDKECVRHVEQGCIENGLRTENARHDRVADESYIGKHQGKANHALIIMIACDETGHPETEYKQKNVGKETYAQKREDERAVGQLIAHY